MNYYDTIVHGRIGLPESRAFPGGPPFRISAMGPSNIIKLQ